MSNQPSGTPEGQAFYEDVSHIAHTSLPFLRKWIQLPKNFEEISQQALQDIEQPGFVAQWGILAIWGRKARER